MSNRAANGLRPHFPGLDPAVRERLGRLGIDPEQSCANFLERIRAGHFPDRLIADFAANRAEPSKHGIYAYRHYGCRCLICRTARRDESRRARAA